MVTRETLSQAINVHPRTIVQWEKDESDPNLENLCLIAPIFFASGVHLLHSQFFMVAT